MPSYLAARLLVFLVFATPAALSCRSSSEVISSWDTIKDIQPSLLRACVRVQTYQGLTRGAGAAASWVTLLLRVSGALGSSLGPGDSALLAEAQRATVRPWSEEDGGGERGVLLYLWFSSATASRCRSSPLDCGRRRHRPPPPWSRTWRSSGRLSPVCLRAQYKSRLSVQHSSGHPEAGTPLPDRLP